MEPRSACQGKGELDGGDEEVRGAVMELNHHNAHQYNNAH